MTDRLGGPRGGAIASITTAREADDALREWVSHKVMARGDDRGGFPVCPTEQAPKGATAALVLVPPHLSPCLL